MTTCQEFYDRVKQDPNAIVMDVGEKHPFIIHEAHALVTLKDGSQANRVLYVTFEYVKKHLKKFKACPCKSCQDTVAAYRLNKKAMRGATPLEIEALMPDSWIREALQ
jgi:hypothetical protein